MGLLSNLRESAFSLLRPLYAAIFLVLISIAIGIAGFMLIEHYNLADAFFMTIITISTVGFSEIRPLSEPGRMFTAFYIITNIGIFTYAITSIVTFVVDGHFKNAFKNIRLSKELNKIQGHTIVCGYGRNGLQTCRELADFNKPFVVIESNEERIKDLEEHHSFLVVTGDATNEDVLKEAGIEKARALISTLPGDAENVYVVLTAKGLNPLLKIISRASNESAEKKLITAGADYVVIPEKIGGTHMARMIVSHGKLPLLDDLFKYSKAWVGIKELEMKNIALVLKEETVGSINVHANGAMVIGIKELEGNYILNPPANTRLDSAQSLILLGDEDQLATFEQNIQKK